MIFEPTRHKTSARGDIQQDGTFQLSTNKENDGAPEGEYRVLIVPPPAEEGKAPPLPVHSKFQNLEATPLKATVTRDRQKNKFTFEVE